MPVYESEKSDPTKKAEASTGTMSMFVGTDWH